MPDIRTYNDNPRDFALELAEEMCETGDLITMFIEWHSHDEIRSILDGNEMSPRFLTSDQLTIDGHNLSTLVDTHDLDAIRTDSQYSNLGELRDYDHQEIVFNSLLNGQIKQAKEQCKNYGLDYDAEKARFDAEKSQ